MIVLLHRKTAYEYTSFSGSCIKYGKLNCKREETDSVFPAYEGFLCDNALMTAAVLKLLNLGY
jgi:hypothetical protein